MAACKVRRLVCGVDDADIIRLAGLADEQQQELSVERPSKRVTRSTPLIRAFDPMILPWSSKCDRFIKWHYVAQADDGQICGWLSAQLNENNERKYIYLAEISTRRIRDDIYGGVGKKLHAALVADAMADKYDFIYLYPVNPKVAEIYIAWGYTKPEVGIPHQFYILNRGPTTGIKNSLISPDPTAKLMTEARQHLIGRKSDFDKYRRAILSDPEHLAGLRDLLIDFEMEAENAPEVVERLRREKQIIAMSDAEKARRENQAQRMREFLGSLPAVKAVTRRGGRIRHRTRRRRLTKKR